MGSLHAPKSLLYKLERNYFHYSWLSFAQWDKILQIKTWCCHWCLLALFIFWPWLLLSLCTAAQSCTPPPPLLSLSPTPGGHPFLQNGAPSMWPLRPHVKQTTCRLILSIALLASGPAQRLLWVLMLGPPAQTCLPKLWLSSFWANSLSYLGGHVIFNLKLPTLSPSGLFFFKSIQARPPTMESDNRLPDVFPKM